MASVPFTKGLHALGNGHFAYLQPSGTWGYSNAGLIVDGDQSLLVDTLFDERLTAEMLDTMHAATRVAAGDITQLVNTHANGDHTFGNRLVTNARIIASEAGAHEMAHDAPPEALAALMTQAKEMGEIGTYFRAIFGPFDFAGVKLRLPDETFSGEKTLKVGDKSVQLIEVGPAHTAGDTLVYVPADKVLYSGDILFIEGTPIMWSGPVRNWIAACQLIIDADVDVVVPGHGPITDKKGVAALKGYFEYIEREARRRYDAGMTLLEAARDISLADYSSWGDSERIIVNVASLYREFSAGKVESNIVELFTMMAQLRRDRRK